VLARLRSDTPHHAGGRRRSGALLPPPDIAHVLRLQRTIGNRATTRLLRQPVAEAERAKPHALKTAGITTDSRVSDETPKWIQAALTESLLLRPYLDGKPAITDGSFKLHFDEDDFNEAAKKYFDNKDLMDKAKRAAAYGKIGGFYDRKTKEVHVRPRTKFGHAVHEAMHKVAHPVFFKYWGRLINEGVTQYFTDCLLKEQGLSEVTDHEYKDELACAKKLVQATSWQVVAAAYFQNDGALRETLMKRFKLDAGQFTREVGAEKICTRLP
jgi:hypothetical protein